MGHPPPPPYGVEVELREQPIEWSIAGMPLWTDGVIVRCLDPRWGWSLTAGLTELDALGAFREHVAFLMQVAPSDIVPEVIDQRR